MKRTLKLISLTLFIAALSACNMKGTGDLTWGGQNVGPGGDGGGNHGPVFGVSQIGTRDFGSFKEQLKAASGIDPISSVADIDPVTTGVQTVRSVWDSVNNTLPQSASSSISAPSMQAAMQLAEAICSANFSSPSTGFFAGVNVSLTTPAAADIKTFADRMARVMWREPSASPEDVQEMTSLYQDLYAGQTTAAQKIRTGWVGLCAVGAVMGSGLEM